MIAAEVLEAWRETYRALALYGTSVRTYADCFALGEGTADQFKEHSHDMDNVVDMNAERKP